MLSHLATRQVSRVVRSRWPITVSGVVAAFIGGSYLFGGASNDASKKQFVTLMNPAQVTARLTENEESLLVERGHGVLRYDVAQLPSNLPIEDDHSESIVNVPFVTPQDKEFNSDWYFWGVYDGHGGWSTSSRLREQLIGYVTRELNKVCEPVVPGSPRRLPPSRPEVIDEAIVNAFQLLDNDIVHRNISTLFANPTKKNAIEIIPPALNGACALLSFYDSASSDLRVAITGDSRAVLGSRDSNGKWTARALTVDQTGSNQEEVARIRSEHPKGEHDSCINRGRVLGIYEPSRSFGDGITKWPREIQQQLAQKFFARRIPSTLKTPPYMTARPEITKVHIDPSQPYFLVMASDGVFELLSNDQVVSLVVDWLDQKRPASLHSLIEKPQNTGWFSLFQKSSERQIGEPVEDVTSGKSQQKQPIRASDGKIRVTVQDENAGTHIMRNALGGADQEQVSMLLSIPSPMSRRYRDDLTVTVVFFGNSEDVTGKVRINKDGTHISQRPKL